MTKYDEREYQKTISDYRALLRKYQIVLIVTVAMMVCMAVVMFTAGVYIDVDKFAITAGMTVEAAEYDPATCYPATAETKVFVSSVNARNFRVSDPSVNHGKSNFIDGYLYFGRTPEGVPVLVKESAKN